MLNTIAFSILTAFVSAGPAAHENTLLTELVTIGVTMPGPGDQVMKLREPAMAEGLNSQQQMEVLKQLATYDKFLKGDAQAFLGKGWKAPVIFKMSRTNGQGNDLIRSIDAYFVVYGDWNVLTSDEFSKSILKKDAASSKNTGGTTVIKAGNLKPAELAFRKLTVNSTSNLKEYYLYTTIQLFSQVEVSATRFGMATKTPTGVVVAAKVAPAFQSDKEFPNQWCPVTRDEKNLPVVEAATTYPVVNNKISGAGFYAKVTRLIQPANAIFVEYHSTFYEPEQWFGAGNDHYLPTQLKTIVPVLVQNFRRKLDEATQKAAQQNAAGVAKPAVQPNAAGVAEPETTVQK